MKLTGPPIAKGRYGGTNQCLSLEHHVHGTVRCIWITSINLSPLAL